MTEFIRPDEIKETTLNKGDFYILPRGFGYAYHNYGVILVKCKTKIRSYYFSDALKYIKNGYGDEK